MLHQDMRYYVEREPKLLREVMDGFSENAKALNSVDIAFDTIVIYATGSSANAAYAAKPFLSKLLQVTVEIKEPSLALNYEKGYNEHSLYFAISQGGHSASTLALIEDLQKEHLVFAITSDPESPVAKQAKHVLMLGMYEEMPFVTAGVASTTLFLWMSALTLAQRREQIDSSQKAQYIKEIEEMIDELPKIIQVCDEWFAQAKDVLYGANRFLCISYGACYGSAREFETKYTETVRVPSAGFELEEFMHGPYIGIQSSDVVFVFDPNGALSERTIKLTKFLKNHIDHVYYFSNQPITQIKGCSFHAFVNEYFSCILYNILIHISSWNISRYKEIDLSKSSYPDFDEMMKSKI